MRPPAMPRIRSANRRASADVVHVDQHRDPHAIAPTPASSSMISTEVFGSSDDVGSSASISRGCCMTARAMPTRCRWPPDNASARRLANPASPDGVEQRQRALDIVRRKLASPRTPRRHVAQASATAGSPSPSAARPGCIPGTPCRSGAAHGAAPRPKRARGRLSVEQDLARRRLDEPIDAADQRALAGARRPDDRGDAFCAAISTSMSCRTGLPGT